MFEIGEAKPVADQKETYEGWSVLELMGHRRLGGYVREVEMFGTVMCRIDIPSEPPATQFVGGASIYALTPTTEEMARAVAKNAVVEPVHRWELPAVSTISPPAIGQRFDDDDEFEF